MATRTRSLAAAQSREVPIKDTPTNWRRRGLARFDTLQKILDVKVRGLAETALRDLGDGRGFLDALQVDLAFLACDVHTRLVAVELVELVVAELIPHRAVVDREHPDE